MWFEPEMEMLEREMVKKDKEFDKLMDEESRKVINELEYWGGVEN